MPTAPAGHVRNHETSAGASETAPGGHAHTDQAQLDQAHADQAHPDRAHTDQDHPAHDHAAHDVAAMMTKEFWDDRYGSAEAIWSGNPNQRLVEHAGELAAGTALDVGCGEGGDAIWLATRGWRVTAIDISTVALDRAAQLAAVAGPDIADRITWRQVDLLSWDGTPPAGLGSFDLVSVQYMHLPGPELRSVRRALAATVRPGGTLLIVGHHHSDVQTSMGRPDIPEMFYTAAEVGAELDPEDWLILAAESPGRQATDPDGRTIMVRDAVVKAVRRGA